MDVMRGVGERGDGTLLAGVEDLMLRFTLTPESSEERMAGCERRLTEGETSRVPDDA